MKFIKLISLFLFFALVSNILYSHHNITKSTEYIDTFIESLMVSQDLPGVAACAVRDGEVIWNGNYGYANIAQNIELDDSSIFMLGSISKTITGIAFLQLYETGLIGLDDDVNIYLPFQFTHPLFPQTIITPRMLMSHVSGIRDNWDVLNPLHYPGGDSPISLSDFIEGYLVPDGIYYDTENFNTSEPCTVYDYSNVGSALIAYLVEVLSGISFEQYCQENIFVPLGMDDTSWFLANLNFSQVAMPYTFNNGNYYPFGHYGQPMYPCGFLRTSALHLAQILLVQMELGTVNNNIILQSNTVELMQTLHYPAIAPEYGFFLQYLDGFWGHMGGGPGVCTSMLFNPIDDIGVIVLLNIENFYAINLLLEELYEFAEQFVVSTEDHAIQKSNNIILSNYPNPFNPSTSISFNLNTESTENTEIVIYNLKGQIVKTFSHYQITKSQNQSITWNGTDINNQAVASGIYYCVFKENGYTIANRKMILIK